MIIKIKEKQLQATVSRIYAIKKQIRIFKGIESDEVSLLTKKTIESLEKSLLKERLILSEQIEKGIERLI